MKTGKNAGETLPETLIALLVVVTTFLFLTGAVVTAARVNASLQNEAVAFHASREEPQDLTVEISMGGSGSATVSTHKYQSENGYVYYR